MSNHFCPICKKEFSDILRHLSIKHEFENLDALAQEIQGIENDKKKREAFNEFISNLDIQLKNKKISIEEWRTLRDNWQFV